MIDQYLPQMMEALAENTTLIVFVLEFLSPDSVFSTTAQDALVSVLETRNMTLTKIEIRNHSNNLDKMKKKVDYYTKLNRLGRKRLLAKDDAATREDWIDTVVTNRDDLDVVFLFPIHESYPYLIKMQMHIFYKLNIAVTINKARGTHSTKRFFAL